MYVSQELKALRINPNNIVGETEYLRTRPVFWITPQKDRRRLVKGDYVVYSETYASEEGVTTMHDRRPIAVYSAALFRKQFGSPHGYRGWYHIMHNHPKR